MVDDPHPTISAQVVLRSADGAVPDGHASITSESIGAYLPPAETVADVMEFFRSRGFAVGSLVGNGFSITAPSTTFETVFQARLHCDHNGARVAESDAYELPRRALPRPIAHDVVAVTFSPPPDFGPTSFHA